MSEFYATIQGNRGQATRQGTKASGISAAAQSWEGSVIVQLWRDGDSVIQVTIGKAGFSSPYAESTLLTVPLSDLLNAAGLDLA